MSTLAQWRRHERWTRAQLEAHQAESLRSLREWASARSPFYQRFNRGLADSPLHELPVPTSTMLMEHFDELVTDRAVRLTDLRAHLGSERPAGRFRDRYWVTAEPPAPQGAAGLFLFDRDEWATVLAIAGRVRDWAGWATSASHILHRMPVASLGSGRTTDMSPQIAKTLNSLFPMNLVMPMTAFDAGRPLAETVLDLNDWQPSMLSGPAALLRMLADEQLGGGLRIRPHRITSESEPAHRGDPAAHQGRLGPGGVQHGLVPGLRLPRSREQRPPRPLPHRGQRDLRIRRRAKPSGPTGQIRRQASDHRSLPQDQPLIRYELGEGIRLSEGPSPSGLPFARIEGTTPDRRAPRP